MNQRPDPDDELLVRFLRQHRPVPPPAPTNERLMNLIEKPSASGQRVSAWAIGAAIAGVIFSWSGYRYWDAQQQPLEKFLVNSWNGTVKATDASYSPHSPEAEWLLLAPNESVNHP